MKKEVFGHADSIDYGKNQNIGKIAAYVIKNHQPDLMMVHVFAVDHAQHLQGRNGLMVEEAVADADETVGIIMNTLKERGLWENTVLMVGGDHGFYNISKNKCHLTQISMEIFLKRMFNVTCHEQNTQNSVTYHKQNTHNIFIKLTYNLKYAFNVLVCII